MRWPEAYDGILSNYPTASFVGLRLWGAALARAVYDDNSAGWIPPGLVNRIAADAVEACDALDGAADGLVSNPDACRGRADTFIEGLRCKNGETGHPEHCLTTAQIERTINIYHKGYSLPYKLADGIDNYQGYNSLEGITCNSARSLPTASRPCRARTRTTRAGPMSSCRVLLPAGAISACWPLTS